MRYLKSAISVLFIFLLFTACKTSKEMTMSNSYLQPTDKINAVTSSYNNWKTFTTKGKITMKGTDKASSSMQIKMIRDKFISISIRPMMGLEMWNLFLTNDSLIIIDKVKKCYVTESLANFSMGFPLTIGTMQDLFLNRAFVVGSGTLNRKNIKETIVTDYDNDIWYVTPRKKAAGFDYTFTFNEMNQLVNLTASQSFDPEPYTVNYSDFEQTPWGYFAKEVKIDAMLGNAPFSLKLAYNSNLIWDGKVNAKINKKSKYKHISFREYLNLYN